MKNLKTKVTAILATALLAISALCLVGAPANAAWGTTIWNNSTGLVTARDMNGTTLRLYGYGATAYNVKEVLITNCTRIGTVTYRSPGAWYRFNYAGQYTVSTCG